MHDFSMTLIKEYKKFSAIKKFIPLFLEKYPGIEVKTLLQGIKKLLKQNRYILLVAYDNEKAVGMAGINFNYLLCSGDFAQISNIYTLPEFRGEGVARSLLTRVEEIAKKHNCTQIALYTYLENKLSAELYKKMGLTQTANYFTKKL